MIKDSDDNSKNDLETRLRVFYGPSLPEQPLSSSAWNSLSNRLESQNGIHLTRKRRWHGVRGLYRSVTPGKALPPFVQESLVHVMNEVRWQDRVPPLYCSIKSTVREPSLHLASTLLFGKPTVYLTLPIDAPIRMERVEIEVLLATGLARLLLINRLASRILRYICACLLLMSYCLAVYGIIHRQAFLCFPIAIGILTTTTLTWQHQQRRNAFKADMLTVHWLGRDRVCEGLHLLADHREKPRRWRLSEPSLEKRIERVCGTRVASKNKDLTLVG